jgi:hypothetical protein
LSAVFVVLRLVLVVVLGCLVGVCSSVMAVFSLIGWRWRSRRLRRVLPHAPVLVLGVVVSIPNRDRDARRAHL